MGVTVINTRPLPDGPAFSKQLERAGLKTLASPVMEIVHSGGKPDLENAGAYAFTSANGVRAWAHASAIESNNSAILKTPVFAVGPMTAQAAREVGFERILVADGDVASLTALISSHLLRDPLPGEIVHVAGANRAGDLASSLIDLNVKARRAVLYEARALPLLAPAIKQVLAHEIGRGREDLWVVFFSPRTVELFVDQLAAAGMAQQVSGINAACLSKAVAEKAAGRQWRSVSTALSPTADAMIALIKAATSERLT